MIHRVRQFALVLAATLFVAASVTAADYNSPVAKLDLADGDSVVFLGDSITHQCLYTQYVEDYFYTRMPHIRLKFHNAGVGGARAWDALERFETDVAAYKPKYVTVLLGMNDGSYKPYDEDTFRTYHQDMTMLISRLRGIDATPILMTPTMYDSRAARMRTDRPAPQERLELYNSVLAYYGTWLREVAVEAGYGFVDMYSPLNNLTLESRKKDANFTLISDSVHPDAPGQVVMAVAIISDMGLPRQVSNIRISKAAGGKVNAVGQHGELADVEFTDEGVQFTWKAESLPWVVPAEAMSGAKLTKLGHRLSREALEIHGLRPGRYSLAIDGEEVGVYSAEALSRHIELQENAKTPQHQQAAQVAELNKQRNDGPVKNLRNEWRAFQQYSRLKAGTKTEANNARIDKLAEQLKGLDVRVAQHQQQAKELEDQIFEVNQPKSRKYVISRVK